MLDFKIHGCSSCLLNCLVWLGKLKLVKIVRWSNYEEQNLVSGAMHRSVPWYVFIAYAVSSSVPIANHPQDSALCCGTISTQDDEVPWYVFIAYAVSSSVWYLSQITMRECWYVSIA